MWVDVVLVLCIVVLFLLVVDGAYRIGRQDGYTRGAKDAALAYMRGQADAWAAAERRPATRDER